MFDLEIKSICITLFFFCGSFRLTNSVVNLQKIMRLGLLKMKSFSIDIVSANWLGFIMLGRSIRSEKFSLDRSSLNNISN